MKTFSKLLVVCSLLSLEAGAQVVGNSTDSRGESGETIIDSIIRRGVLQRHRGGNGGDSIGSQFATIAKNSSKAMEAHCRESGEPICDHLESFKETFVVESPEFVTVLSTGTVEADDGREREAVNDRSDSGKAYIVVSEKKWKDIESYSSHNSSSRKINLVLHEYFSLMGLETSDYYDSSRALSDIFEQESYNLSAIAANTNLPDPNSVFVIDSENFPESKLREVKSKIAQLGYKLTGNQKDSRFNLRINLECAGILSKTCSIYVELEDNYKHWDKTRYSKHLVEKSFRRKKVINSALSKIFAEFPAY